MLEEAVEFALQHLYLHGPAQPRAVTSFTRAAICDSICRPVYLSIENT
jgi:hypothetical protein